MGMETSSLLVVSQNNTSGVGTSLFSVTSTGVVARSPVRFMQDSTIIHDKVILNKEVLAASVDNAVFTVLEGRWRVSGFSYLPRVVGSGGAATIDLKVCTGTQAPSAGTTQLSAALDLVGVADTLQQATLIASPTVLGPGDRVAFDLTGTLTSVVGNATVNLIRIS